MPILFELLLGGVPGVVLGCLLARRIPTNRLKTALAMVAHPCRIAACVDRKPFNGFETRDEFRKDHCTARSWPCTIAAQTYANMRKADRDRSLRRS